VKGASEHHLDQSSVEPQVRLLRTLSRQAWAIASKRVHCSSGQFTSPCGWARSLLIILQMGTKRDIQRETGPPIFTHLERKTDWGFPYVLGPDTKQPNSQEILHLLVRGAGSYRRHHICHCVVAHTKRPYAATLVFTPPDMSLCSDAGFPARALLISNCLWEPLHQAGSKPLPWPMKKRLDARHCLLKCLHASY